MPMLSHCEQVKRHFNKANKTYDQHCGLQQSTGEKLIGLTRPLISHINHIIDLGCGTGLTTEKVAHAFSYRTFHALDIAKELLNKTKQRLPSIVIHESSFDDLPDQHFDLIFSNMALQWSQDLSHTLATIKSRLSPKGLLVFSIPLAGTLIELKHNYALNHFFSDNDVQRYLQQHELTLLEQKIEKISLHFDTLFSALKSIKNVGANYTGRKLHTGLRGKTLLNKRMAQRLTYVIGYYIVKNLHDA